MKFGFTFGLIKDGHKTMTSRIPAEKWYEWYNSVGMQPKVVQAEGSDGEKLPIRLTGCTVQKLGYVKEHFYWEEGFSSPEAFEETWRKLYHSFNPDLLVCSIFFEKVKTA